MARLVFLATCIAILVFMITHRNHVTFDGTRDEGVAEAREAVAPAPGSEAPRVPTGSQILPPKQDEAKPAEKEVAWDDVSLKLKRVHSLTPSQLADLYAEAGSVIRKDEAAFFNSLPALKLLEGHLEDSFFAMSAWIRYSHNPTAFLQSLTAFQTADNSRSTDFHHEVQTENIKRDRIQAYGLHELRKQMEAGRVNLSESETRQFVQSLQRITQNPSASMDTSIETFQMLSLLKQTDVINSALGNYSDRDRRLIAGLLKAN